MNNGKSTRRPLTKKQQQAVIVCAVCALALILTISVTAVLVTKQIKAHEVNANSQETDEDYNAIDYVVDSGSVLVETENAGDSYLTDTLFIGDSNTVRLYNNGLITLQQYCAKEGLTIQNATSTKFVNFKKDPKAYTIAEAVAKMKPRRVVITLGTNNAAENSSEKDFIESYRKLISDIKSSYSYTDIIVNAIPPIPKQHAKYSSISQKTIDKYNMALIDMCEDMECKFLNSAEALKDETGYGQSGYYGKDDIHLTLSGAKTLLDYCATHAYSTEDRRPDTNNIAQRAEDFTSSSSNNATATATPEAGFTASYYVQPKNSGTLSSGELTGKSSIKIDVNDTKKSVTVTAVPNEGYVFVNWSDGITSLERTDKDFKQNLDVTALFVDLKLSVSAAKKDATVGDELKFNAKLSKDKYAKADSIVWFVNGQKVDGASGESFSMKAENEGEVEVYAEVTYNSQKLRSGKVSVTVEKVKPTPTPDPTPTPTPAATPTPSPTATPTPSPTATPTPSPTATPTPTPEENPTEPQEQKPVESPSTGETENQENTDNAAG